MIFIKNNIPSSKNSKVNGKYFSKTVRKFLRSHGIQSFSTTRKEVVGYKTIPMTFPVNEIKWMLEGKEYPIILGFHFVRDSKHKFDFGNICQIILDLLTAFDLIEDDNMDCLIPVPIRIEGKWYSYDKENPGVYLMVLNDYKFFK